VRLVHSQRGTKKQMISDVNKNDRLVSKSIDLFKGLKWIKSNEGSNGGTYTITMECQMSLNRIRSNHR
jgi:hypothetical protein